MLNDNVSSDAASLSLCDEVDEKSICQQGTFPDEFLNANLGEDKRAVYVSIPNSRYVPSTIRIIGCIEDKRGHMSQDCETEKQLCILCTVLCCGVGVVSHRTVVYCIVSEDPSTIGPSHVAHSRGVRSSVHLLGWRAAW